jgi:hypothetical protein
MPQDLGLVVQTAAASVAPELEAKVENFLWSFVEPHFGQGVPCHWLERTNTSLSVSQASQ